MREGLYRAQFTTPLGSGAGVINLVGNQFRGGDGAIACVGELAQDGNAVTAKFRTFRHKSNGGMSVLGSDDASMVVAGKAVSDTSVLLTGNVPGTAMQFTVKLDRLAA